MSSVEFTTDKRGSRNTIAEGWHLRFKFLVQCTNPILWTFLDAIKLEQGLTDQKIDVLLKLRAPEPRTKKWIEVDQKLEKKMVAYDNDRYEILKFLDVIAATY